MDTNYKNDILPNGLPDEDVDRKPNIDMALQAKEDFPDIDFSKSLMIWRQRIRQTIFRKIGS